MNTIPAFETIINEFYAALTEIDGVYQIQQGNTTGSTQLKQQAEKEMIDATVKLAAAMYVYAQIEGKPDLLVACKVSPSLLGAMSAEKLKITCTNVYTQGAQLGDALVDYGQSVEDVSQLKNEIDEFATVIAAPRNAIVTRAQARQELDVLMKEANDLLRNKADKLIELLKASKPKVYNIYKAARVIVDLRAGSKLEEEE
ncbi:hypothetical protein J1N10_11650 [Carboxylicivirga sp. A043]|uniref:hypothetical protein n=1 Tax=Carboxylicivirga litoralis TaxID=2816963 RepID=UPI0021CAE6B5|nr:hypothetical protein [Carboxylicivirga sp. A043]MCU4156632.1 hypothetical protein [Carboxylicivirga sp. A043]